MNAVRRTNARPEDPFGANVQRLHELAQMHPLSYESIRVLEAEGMGVRVAMLDREVKKLRAELEESAALFPMIEQWPEPVDGAGLLNAITAELLRYVILPDHGAETVALWILHTYVIDRLDLTPILAIESATMRSGKTTLLTCIAWLANKAVLASNISPAGLFRFVELYRPSLLIDEADTYLRQNDALRCVLNSGHTRAGARVVRCVGDEYRPKSFSTFAPRAIALIGKLPPTLQDRSVVLQMRRKGPGERVQRLRQSETERFRDLCRRCLRWAADVELPETEPLGELNDRAGDNWRVLLSVALAAGADWPTRTRDAANSLSGKQDDTGSVREQLLADIKAYFDLSHSGRVTSADLCVHLATLETRPWAEWKVGKPITPVQLARLLADFGIVPRTLRIDAGTAKGYLRDSFLDSFARYLPPDRTVTSSQAEESRTCDGSTSRNSDAQVESVSRLGEPSQPKDSQRCAGVTDQIPPSAARASVRCIDCQYFALRADSSGRGYCAHFCEETDAHAPFDCSAYRPAGTD